ncbi:MAG: Phosphoglucosamine mutase, partial [uncultured bacterium]
MTEKKLSGLKIFGTDGIRARFGEFPLDNESIIKLGLAIGQWAQEKYVTNNNQTLNILIGHDTRISCDSIKQGLAAGLLTHNAIIRDAQVIPTPAIVKFINNKCDYFNFGIIITASHNPYQDNGIKIVDSKIGKLDKSDEDKITEFFYSNTINSRYLKLKDSIKNSGNTQQEHDTKCKCSCENISPIRPELIKGPNDQYKILETLQEEYVKTITRYFKKDLLKNIKIALDCANGATYKVAPEIFKQLGAEILLISHTPDGKNINQDCGSTHPENLQKFMLNNSCDIGFAFDGDGDRIAAISKNGQTKDGDDILCILSQHPEYKKQTAIVGTIMSNYGLEIYLNKYNKELIRANVGDKNVCKEMVNKNLLVGGEPSGHIVLRDYLSCGDGI